MSHTILVIGESGSGKSTSVRTLNPEETFIINVIDKPLPFKEFKKNYSKFNKENTKGNYVSTDNFDTIIRIIQGINEERLSVKNLIIDDFQYIMANEFMRRSKERGYDKFTEIGNNAWQIIRNLMHCREDLNCVVLSHSDTDVNGKIKCKTIGKMLDDKITLEGMFTIVLHAITNEDKYKFLTQHTGNYIAKSPFGMFPDKAIDNDLSLVINNIKSYYGEQL